MHGEPRRRIEVDDAIRKQMQVRVIEEDEVETVVNNPQATTYPKRRGRPIEGRFLFRGPSRPGRILEVEAQLRADNGLYRIIMVREV